MAERARLDKEIARLTAEVTKATAGARAIRLLTSGTLAVVAGERQGFGRHARKITAQRQELASCNPAPGRKARQARAACKTCLAWRAQAHAHRSVFHETRSALRARAGALSAGGTRCVDGSPWQGHTTAHATKRPQKIATRIVAVRPCEG